MSADVTDLVKRLARHETQMESLNAEIAELKQKVAGLELHLRQPLSNSHGPLDEASTKMLLLIANAPNGAPDSDIIDELGLNPAKGQYHLDQLIKRKFIQQMDVSMGADCDYAATAAGREYLARTGQL